MQPDPIRLEQLFYVFHRMHGFCLRYELERRGLGAIGNPAALFVLHQHDGELPMTQRELADHLGVSPPTIAVSVKRMERAGLVSKRAGEADSRKNYIALTDKGRALANDCVLAEKGLCRQIFAGFTPDEVERLRGYYLRMIHNMRASGCRGPAFASDRPLQPNINENEETT